MLSFWLSLCAALAPQDVRVSVRVNFGVLERAPIEREVTLARGSTAVDAARALATVEQDWLCCSNDDVWSIGGVGPDPRSDLYWMWKLGEDMGPDLPARYVVQNGDRIEWTYAGDLQVTQLEARAVSLLPAATEIAIAIGAESALVGVSHLCAMPQGANLPRVMSTTVDSDRWSMGAIDRYLREASARKEALYALDEERIAKLAPTVVMSQGLCPVCAVTPEDVDKALDEHTRKCAKLLVLSPHSLADVAANIREVGDALGRSSAAKIAARDFERRIEKVRAVPRASVNPRVVVIEWFDPLWVSGEWIAEMVEAAGGEPMLVGAKDFSRRIEWKDLVAADPDVIVLAACSMNIPRAERELGALTSREEWRSLRAAREGLVFVMDGEKHFSTPGPGLAVGLEALHRLLRNSNDARSSSTAAWKRITP